MEIIRNQAELAALVSSWRADGQRVGFVPTMGALHDGHLSLVTLAHQHADHVVVSVFVNPTQFAPDEDFDSYPRQENADADQLRQAGVSALYLPSAAEIYPDDDRSCDLDVGDAAMGLETDFRPHFFGGVVNVVSRLFAHAQPDIAVFGQKDCQQLEVIRDMVTRYDMGIDIIAAPIARDVYGLALSSRNAYLSDDDVVIARQLNVVLRRVADGSINEQEAEALLLKAGFNSVDYVSCRWGRVLAAAWLGKTRLIDNIAMQA